MFSHILLASDGSPCALHAASVAAEIAKQFRSRFTIVTVYHPSPMMAPEGSPMGYEVEPEIIENIQQRALADTGRIVAGKQVAYQCRELFGNSADLIAETAQKEQCDLVVLGSRGLSGVQSFLLGSVSERVTHLTHCPVLIVK